jgi:phosphatidylinositol alpha-mannosyltransferase
VTPDKGYEVALEALRSLPAPVKLLIAGGTRVEHEGGYMETLRETIQARGLESRVAITGYLEESEVTTAMALSDVVLAPHTAANGSYSALIAVAHGKPVLASDLDCFRELHDEAGCLELFDTGDETRLAERAGFLLASASTRERLSRLAREYAVQRGWPAVAEATLAIYRLAS